MMLSLSACNSESGLFGEEEYTISGTGEKTPLEIAVSIQDSYAGPTTRALDGTFEKDDQLIAFVQQVKLDNSNYTDVGEGAAQVSKLVTFTVGQAGDKKSTVTSDNLGVTLYWDDFSNTTNDITNSDRYLRVGYGFCYNGGNPTTTLKEANGTVGWTVLDDQSDSQSASDNIRKSDLLWAGNQTAVKYDHDHVRPGAPDIVKLPVTYTHAMSKVTIEIVLDEGFAKTTDGKAVAFGTNNTTPTLYANKNATVVDAINQNIKTTVVSGDDAKITMRLAEDEKTPMHRVYEAIIAPTVMKAGNVLAEVTVDGNKYELKLTDELLKTVYPASSGNATWASQLYGYSSSETDGTITVTKNTEDTQKDETNPNGITLSGINYRLVATLKKQRIEVEAKILPWTDVTASTTGTISFDADVVYSDVKDATESLTSGSFDLWRATENTVEANYDYNGDTPGVIDKASTFEYNSDSKKWVAKTNENILYWEHANTPYYFRALAKTSYDEDGVFTGIETVGGSTAVAQTYDAESEKATTVDLLWAQTSKHEIKDVNEEYYKDDNDPEKNKVIEAGEAINPRTGNVPLTFEHAMSKISVVLATSEVEAEKVNIEGAKISIINLYNSGTIQVSDGKIVNLTAPNTENGGDPMTINGVPIADMKDYLVIPQSLTHYYEGTTLTERTSTPVFYSSDQLTPIYPDENLQYGEVSINTSIGSGDPTYYLTSDLEAVHAVQYSNSDEDLTLIHEHNSKLEGSKKEGDIQTPEVLRVDYDYNGFITDKHHQTFTLEQFQSLPVAARVKIPHQYAQYYTILEEFRSFIDTEDKYLALNKAFRQKDAVLYASAEEYNDAKGTSLSDEEFAALSDNDKIKEPAGLYNYNEFKGDASLYELFRTRLIDDNIVPKEQKLKSEEVQQVLYESYEEYKQLDKITEAMFNALPEELRIKTPHAAAVLYTEETANAYNLTLPGAIHVGDVKVPAHYVIGVGKNPDPHNAGDLSRFGDKIMMYIFLSDGTRYSAELSKCLDSTGEPVIKWERNKHYTYTITLTKEKISFRALVKKWEEKTVGGNATLDWD